MTPLGLRQGRLAAASWIDRLPHHLLALIASVLATGPHTDLTLHQRYSQEMVSAHRSLTYILEELAAREEPDAVFNVNVTHRSAQWPTRSTSPPATVNSAFFPNATAAVLYERRLYGEVIMQAATPDLSRADTVTAGAYRALYRDVTASVPAHSGEMDIYRSETALTWVKDPCPAGGVNRTQHMIVVPLDAAHAEQRFRVQADGVRVGDACLWRAPLPEYAIAKILLSGGIGALVSDGWREERRRRHAAISAGPPAARSTFDVYLEDGALTYIKSPCVRADTEAPFFVHVVPCSLAIFPSIASDIFDGVCMATLELPDYPIANVATGQYTPDGGLWRVDIGGR